MQFHHRLYFLRKRNQSVTQVEICAVIQQGYNLPCTCEGYFALAILKCTFNKGINDLASFIKPEKLFQYEK